MIRIQNCITHEQVIIDVFLLGHKKVLLHECKWHTDHGVSSTPSVTQGGVPPQQGTPWQGTPQPGLTGEYPKWGTPWQGTHSQV